MIPKEDIRNALEGAFENEGLRKPHEFVWKEMTDDKAMNILSHVIESIMDSIEYHGSVYDAFIDAKDKSNRFFLAGVLAAEHEIHCQKKSEMDEFLRKPINENRSRDHCKCECGNVLGRYPSKEKGEYLVECAKCGKHFGLYYDDSNDVFGKMEELSKKE